MKRLTLPSFAKINLYLHVGPRRSDGYHELDTVFQEISLHDTLTFLPASRIELQAERSAPAGDDNIIVRALKKLQRRMGLRKGLRVQLKKIIPMGAGLGGGSSNAAAALWGGWLCWMRRPVSAYRRGTPSVLKELAPQLGADVAFFLEGGRAWGRGIGDQLVALPPMERRAMVLIYPNLHVSTPKAYGLIDSSTKTAKVRMALNSFEPVVFKSYPVVRSAFEWLKKAGLDGVRMSGSGSTVFGFANNDASAKFIAGRVPPALGRGLFARTIPNVASFL